MCPSSSVGGGTARWRPIGRVKNAVSYLLQENDQKEEEGAYHDNDAPGIELDLSCSTGFVGIGIAKSGSFQYVLMLDYSRQMLNEAVAITRRETNRPVSSNVISDKE